MTVFKNPTTTLLPNIARERKDIFGRRDVVESFRFHPKQIVFFQKCLNNPSCDNLFTEQLFTLCFIILYNF